MKETKKKQNLVHVEDGPYEKLKEVSHKTGINMKFLVSRAVENHLENLVSRINITKGEKEND